MRLLQLQGPSSFSLVEILTNIPPYAILSHTWGPGSEEVTYQDLLKGTGEEKPGYRKLIFCGEQAAKDDLHYFWVDTCCIDKASSAELTEAINSMFRWYHEGAKCYVYLPDVSNTDYAEDSMVFQRSRWFTRGWTLQELLAPTCVEFFSREGDLLGNKTSLIQEIAETTTIDKEALLGKDMSRFTVEERIQWASKRNTTRGEDKAYSLLGIFGIFMSLIYGEGEENAFRRLRKKINKYPEDALQQINPGISLTSNQTLGPAKSQGSCDNFNLHSKQYQDQRGTKCSCTAAMLTDEKLDPISANRRGRKRDSSSPLLLRLEPRHGNDENVEELLSYIANPPLHPRKSIYTAHQLEAQDEGCSRTRHESQNSRKGKQSIAADNHRRLIGPQPKFQKLTVSDYQQAGSICPIGCICKCHAPRRFKFLPHTYLWGSLGVTISAASGNKSLCTETSCSRRLMSVARATYRFPYWFVARVWCFTMTMQPQVGFNTSLKVLRVVPDDADIMRFAKTGDTQGVRSLIEQGLASPLDVNASWNVPVLSYAVQGHHTELCRFLLNECADPRVENQSNVSALDRAWDLVLAQNVNIQVKEQLRSVFSLEYDSVWFEEQQFTTLHKIIFGAVGQNLQAELQLSTSAINQQDSKGRTPLTWASARGDEDSVETLLKFGADPNINCATGNSPLLRSVIARSPRCIRLLLGYGADALHKNTLGFTALHYAAYYKDAEEYLTPLLDSSLPVDEKDSYGWTALAATAEYDHAICANVLLRRGADIETRDKNGWTPLLRAINSNSHSVLKLLLGQRANHCALSFRNETVLHFAAGKADLETLEILSKAALEHLDVDAKNEKDQRAVDVMKSRNPQPLQLVSSFSILIESLRSHTVTKSDDPTL